MVIVLALILLALNAADWWTTRRVLAGGGVERNPLMRWVLDRWGFAGLAVAKAVLVGLPAALCVAHDLVWILAVLCAAYAAVVANNFLLLRRG